MSLELVHNNRKRLMGVLKEMYGDTYGDIWEDYFIEPAEIHGACEGKLDDEGKQTLREGGRGYRFHWIRPF